jgi:hypothetical protein
MTNYNGIYYLSTKFFSQFEPYLGHENQKTKDLLYEEEQNRNKQKKYEIR